VGSITTRVLYDLVARDNASRTFLRVGEAAGGLESRASKVGAAISKGLKVGTLAAGAFAVASVHAAADFQTSMTKISTQAGGSAKDVKVLSDQVLKLGGKVQQAPEQLADSLYHLKSVGMDNVDAMKALKQASDLAAVGGAGLEETTNALAGAWRTGIKGAGNFHEAVSTVNAIIGAGNMRMEDFNAAIGTGILASAKTFGLSLNQVGAALALMTDEGIPATDAATRLRMSFSLLGAPSQAAEKQLKKIGLTGLDLAKAMRGPQGLIGAVSLLKEHLDKSGMSAAQESQLLSRAFGGGRSSSGILTLLNNLDVLRKKQDQVNKSTGNFDAAVKRQRQTAEAEWKRLESALESGSVRLGTVLLPPVTSFVTFLNDKAMPAASRFGRILGSLVPVQQIKGAIREAESTIGGFLSGLTGGKGLGGTVSDFLGGLAGGRGVKLPKASAPKNLPPSAIAHGIGVTPSMNAGNRAAPLPKNIPPSVAAHGLIPQKIAAPPSAAKQLGTSIRNAISGGIDHIDWGKLGSHLGKGLANAIGWVGKHTADLVKQLIGIFSNIDWVEVGKAFGGSAIPLAIGFIENAFAPLFSLDFWKKHWLDTIIAVVSVIPIGRAAGALGKVFEHIPFLKVFKPLLDGVGRLGGWLEKGFGKYVLKPLGRFGRAMWDGIVAGFTKVFPESAGKLSGLIGKLAYNIFGYAGRFAAAGLRLIEGLGRGILSIGGKIGEWTGRIIGWIVKPFARAGSWLIGKGKALVGGLKDGAVSVGKSIGGWMWRTIGRPAVDAFKGAGSWLKTKGGALVSGLKSGMTTGAKAIGGFTNRWVISPVTDAFKTSGSWLKTRGGQMVGGFRSGVSTGARAIGGFVNKWVIKPVTGAFSTAGKWLWSAGGHLLSGLKSGIVGAIKGIGGWIKKYFIDPIVGSVKHFFGIHSPSRVFMGIGGHLVGGLLKGMASTSGTDIAKTIFGDLPHALGSIVHKGLVSITKLPGKALKALGGLGGDILGLLGLGGGGGGSSANQKIGATLAATRGWMGPQWTALQALWNGESGWNERALNKSSGAYGIPQALPAGKMASAGSDWKTNPATQIKWGLSYIASRYGNPLNAYSAWLSRSPHWYAKGTGGAAPGLAWVGERGPELVSFNGGENVLSHKDSMTFAKANGIRVPGYASGTIQNAADRVSRDRQKVEDAKDALSRAKRRHKGEAAAEKHLKAAEKELAAAEIALKNARRSAKTSISNSIATGLLKTLSTGTASAITSAIKSLATKLLNAGFNKTAASVQKKGGQLEKLASKKASIESQIKAANQYASDQASNISDFLSISGTSATDVGGLISQLSGQEKTASSFVSLTKSLKARGASKALLQQLSDAGPGSQLAAILGAKSVTTTDISKLNSLVASGGKLASSFGHDMADLMYDSGKDASKGFLAGLKSQEKELGKQMAKLASDLVKQIKKALKIKSPSQVFRDEVGKQVALGMVVGMDAHRPHIAAAAHRMATTARKAAVLPSLPTRQSAALDRLSALLASGQAGGTEVHVHFDDDRLRDLIDVRVKPKIKQSESTQAYRAKVGRRSG
jgi:TP901 family phage tail tape measure protein